MIKNFFYTMPLILMCGTPGSGKTTRAKQIAEYLSEKHKKKICLINEEMLGVQKGVAFACTCAEM